MFNFDAEVVFQVNDGTLVMTTTVYTNEGPISGTRQFLQCDSDILPDLTPKCSRRASMSSSTNNARPTSISSSPNNARRRSRTISPRPIFQRETGDVLIEERLEKSKKLGNNPLFQKNKTPERKSHIDHGRPNIEISQH